MNTDTEVSTDVVTISKELVSFYDIHPTVFNGSSKGFIDDVVRQVSMGLRSSDTLSTAQYNYIISLHGNMENFAPADELENEGVQHEFVLAMIQYGILRPLFGSSAYYPSTTKRLPDYFNGTLNWTDVSKRELYAITTNKYFHKFYMTHLADPKFGKGDLVMLRSGKRPNYRLTRNEPPWSPELTELAKGRFAPLLKLYNINRNITSCLTQKEVRDARFVILDVPDVPPVQYSIVTNKVYVCLPYNIPGKAFPLLLLEGDIKRVPKREYVL